MTKQASKGYVLPEAMPEGYRCYQVWVPDCDEAKAAFWGSLDYLSKWMAWERTPDRRGRDMAQLFYWGIQLSRDNQEGGCGVLQVRQNVNYPCLLEYSDNGGVTWVEFADITKCPTLPPAPTDNSEELSKDITWALWYILDVIRLALDGGATADEATLIAVTASQKTWGGSYHVVWHAAAVAMAEHTPEERAAACDPDNFEQIHAVGWCGSHLTNPLDDFLEWLEQWTESVLDWWEATTEWLFESLFDVLFVLMRGQGLYAAAYGGTERGADWPWPLPECPGQWRWLFDGDDPPYTIVHGYIGGDGVGGTDCLWGVDWGSNHSAEMRADIIADGTLTHFAISFNHKWGTPNYVGVGFALWTGAGVLKQVKYQVFYPTWGTWTTWAAPLPDWACVAGDYVTAFVSNSGAISGITNKLDNLWVYGSAGVFPPY
jgi:hypothetical protein